MSRSGRNRSAPRLTSLEVLAFGLRMLILLLAVQLSGTAAVAVEAGFGSLDRADCRADCPLESNGKECPPGCPSCHCTHGQIASLPASSSGLEIAQPPR